MFSIYNIKKKNLCFSKCANDQQRYWPCTVNYFEFTFKSYYTIFINMPLKLPILNSFKNAIET